MSCEVEAVVMPGGEVRFGAPTARSILLSEFAASIGSPSESEARSHVPHGIDQDAFLCSATGCVVVGGRGRIGEPDARQRIAMRRLCEEGVFERSQIWQER